MTTPTMTIDGVEYVEEPERNVCEGCAFTRGDCENEVSDEQQCEAFGGNCIDRRVIYLRKE